MVIHFKNLKSLQIEIIIVACVNSTTTPNFINS